MPDMDKVMKGLEMCADISGARCVSCPYYKDDDCPEKLAADALDLLKEQEAAYQGAEKLLEQKTILFEDAIRRLKNCADGEKR